MSLKPRVKRFSVIPAYSFGTLRIDDQSLQQLGVFSNNRKTRNPEFVLAIPPPSEPIFRRYEQTTRPILFNQNF